MGTYNPSMGRNEGATAGSSNSITGGEATGVGSPGGSFIKMCVCDVFYIHAHIFILYSLT
jgi:hypothetical protein